MRLPPRLLSLALSLPPFPYLTLSRSPHSLFWFISPSPSLRPFSISSLLFSSLSHTHLKPPCFPFPLFLSLFFSLSLLLPPPPHLPCRCLVSLVPFKARQMERQALSPSSGPNDLFLTMGPNGPQIINDEGSMERWATERVREGERKGFRRLCTFSACLFFFLFFLLLLTNYTNFKFLLTLHSLCSQHS